MPQRPLGWSIGRSLRALDEVSPEEEALRLQELLHFIEHMGEDRSPEEQQETLDLVMQMLENDPFRIE